VQTNGKKILVSYYQWAKPRTVKYLIVVANIGRETSEAKLKIDKAALGLEGRTIQFKDLWNDKKLTADEVKSLSLKGNHLALIGILP